MLVGPVFTREVVTAPRRTRLYAARSIYVAALLILLSTSWQVLTGTQVVRSIGDLARFGTTSFQVLVPIQLVVALFFSSLSAAGAVAHEKDRRTLELLLMTRLTNSELVLGKLLASQLSVLVLIVAGLPAFMLLVLLGGVSFAQVARTFVVTLAAAWAAGSVGSMVALWRDKTFQSLALTVLVLVLWLAAGEVLAAGLLGTQWRGIGASEWATMLSPWRAMLVAASPVLSGAGDSLGATDSIVPFLCVAIGLGLVCNVWATIRVRAWNPRREPIRSGPAETEPQHGVWGSFRAWEQRTTEIQSEAESSEAHARPAARAAAPARDRARPKTRRVWDNPVLWREIRTWAYGRRMLIVRLIYLGFFALSAMGVYYAIAGGGRVNTAQIAASMTPLLVLSLVLINTQAVTALTSERDARTLDLLLVTRLEAKDIIYGKLGGIFYNTKEIVLLPMLLAGYLWWARVLSLENLCYIWAGWLVMAAFAATLGIHAAMTYTNSRAAIGVSLGTVFFLFVGIATCMRIMVAFSGPSQLQFQVQFQAFFFAMVGGGVGLLVALGWRNPSSAIWIASFTCPLATFYAITSVLQNFPLATLLAVVCAYGFATAAMLVPAIAEFDVATGRTTAADH